MKYRAFLAAITMVALASCHSTYRATDATVVVGSSELQEKTFLVQYPNAANAVWVTYDPSMAAPIDWQLVGYTPLDASARLVHFSQDNQNYYVLYDRNGFRVASAYVLSDFTVMPVAVTDKLQILFPAYTVTGLSRVTLNDGRMAFEVEQKKWYYTARVLIDDNGNVIDERLVVADHV